MAGTCYWVGLTGGIGSGKSQVAAEFINLGIQVIDADAISRRLTADQGTALPEIYAKLGKELFDDVGRLNRTALRNRVFTEPETKHVLESIMHPLIFAQVKYQQSLATGIYGIVDIPLLVEQQMFSTLVSRILVIDVCEQTQINRICLRNGFSVTEAKRIIAAQASRQARLMVADDVLSNEGGISDLAIKVYALNRYYHAYFSYFTGIGR